MVNHNARKAELMTDAAHVRVGDVILSTYYPGRGMPGLPIELTVIAVTPVGSASVDIRYTGFDGAFNGGKRRMRRNTPVTVRRTV